MWMYIYIYAQAQTKNQAFARAISPRSGSSISVNRIRRRQSGATAASHLLRGTRNVLTAVPHRGLTDTGCTHRCAIHPSWSPRSLPKVPRPGPRQAADAPGRRHRPPSPSHEAFVMKGGENGATISLTQAGLGDKYLKYMYSQLERK